MSAEVFDALFELVQVALIDGFEHKVCADTDQML